MYNLIIQPVVALMTLTFLVWCYMYFRRLRYVVSHQISANKLETPEQCNSVLPATINKISNNLKNLFEMPVIFYVICVFSASVDLVDPALVYLAWAFVAFRTVHSAFHCFSKSVMARFCAYFISSIILWAMVAKFAYMAIIVT